MTRNKLIHNPCHCSRLKYLFYSLALQWKMKGRGCLMWFIIYLCDTHNLHTEKVTKHIIYCSCVKSRLWQSNNSSLKIIDTFLSLTINHYNIVAHVTHFALHYVKSIMHFQVSINTSQSVLQVLFVAIIDIELYNADDICCTVSSYCISFVFVTFLQCSSAIYEVLHISQLILSSFTLKLFRI